MIKLNKLPIGLCALMLVWALFLEVLAVYIVYETIGWLAPLGFVVVLLPVNLGLLVVYCLRFRIGALLALSWVLWIYMFVGPLGIRWYYVDREAKHLVAWAQAEQARTGGYPDDLRGYSFLRPECKEYIFYNGWDYSDEGIKSTPRKFQVDYVVGSRDTGHRYSSEYGWYYDDD